MASTPDGGFILDSKDVTEEFLEKIETQKPL